MIKKFVYIGLLLVLIFFIALIASSGYLFNQIKSSSYYINKTLEVNAFNYSYFSLPIQNLSKFALILKSNNPVNFYLFNGSGFNKWNNSVASNLNKVNGLNEAKSQINNGIILINQNTTLIQYPESSPNVYQANLTKQKLNQTYYFVIDNTNGSKSASKNISVSIIYVYLNSTLVPIFSRMAIIGLITFIILIAGIVLIVFGILKKNKNPAQENKNEEMPEEIKKIYSDIEQKHKPLKTSAKHQSRSRNKNKK